MRFRHLQDGGTVFGTCKRGHPYDTMILLPDEIVRALFEVLTKEPLDTCKWRLQCIQQWQRWATECEAAEKDLKLRMHKDLRSIVAHLRISLMKKVGAQIGWTDATLWDQLADGALLGGFQGRLQACFPERGRIVRTDSLAETADHGTAHVRRKERIHCGAF